MYLLEFLLNTARGSVLKWRDRPVVYLGLAIAKWSAHVTGTCFEP